MTYYDSSSLRGDEICYNMDEENNLFNPPSPQGYFFYRVIGRSFDRVDEELSISINNRYLESAEGLYLDNNWGKRLKIPRNGLSDEAYRAVLIANSYETLTVIGIKVTLATILDCEYEDIIIVKSSNEGNIKVTDVFKNITDDYVTDFSINQETMDKTITDNISKSFGKITLKYPQGLNTIFDDGTTLIDLVSPYIGFVEINYEEYMV